MRMLEKLSPELKKENEIYKKQLRSLALHFSSIEDTETRDHIITFMKKLSGISEEDIESELKDRQNIKSILDRNKENLLYTKSFLHCINKIDSVALKDKVMELIEVFTR